MAILGFEVVFSITLISFFQKINKFYSLGQAILTHKIYRYESSSTPTESKPSTSLKRVPLTPGYLLSIPFYPTAEWLLDFCFVTAGIFNISYIVYRIYIGWFIASPLQTSSIHPPLLDLTLVWNICTLGFALSALIRPLITYPRHEKTLLIIAGIISALLCLAISFYIDFKHNYFITGISDTGNSTVNAAAGESGEKINKEFVSYEGWDQYRTTERAWLKNFKEIRFKLFYHFVLSLCSAILGSMIFFPCLRWAQMFIDAYGYSNRLDQKFFLFLNAIGPGISTLFWFFKPLLLTFTYNRYDDTTPLLNQDLASKFVKLNIIWLYSHIIFGVLRVALLRPHIQAYLYMAYEKVQAIDKKENTSALAFNKSVKNAVNRINFYLGIVCIQYIVPVIISSSLTYILLSPTDASTYLKTDNENGSVNLIGDQTNLHDQLNSSHFIDLITRWTHQNASALSPPFKLLIFDPSILKAPVTQILFMFDVLMCVFGIFGYCYHKYN